MIYVFTIMSVDNECTSNVILCLSDRLLASDAPGQLQDIDLSTVNTKK